MCFKWIQVKPEFISADERRKLDEKYNNEILKQYNINVKNEMKRINFYINNVNKINIKNIKNINTYNIDENDKAKKKFFLSCIFEENIKFLTSLKYKVEFIKGKEKYMRDKNGNLIYYGSNGAIENEYIIITCIDKIITDGDDHYKISW